MTTPTRFVADASLWQRADTLAEAAVGGQFWYAALALAAADRSPPDENADREASAAGEAERCTDGLLVVRRGAATKAWALRGDPSADPPPATIAVLLEADEFDRLQRMLDERPRAVQFDFHRPVDKRHTESAAAADELLDWHFWVTMECGADAARRTAGEDKSPAADEPADDRRGPTLSAARLSALSAVFELAQAPRDATAETSEPVTLGERVPDAEAGLTAASLMPAAAVGAESGVSVRGGSTAADANETASLLQDALRIDAAVAESPPAAAAGAGALPQRDAVAAPAAIASGPAPTERTRASPRRALGIAFGFVAVLHVGTAWLLATRQPVPTAALNVTPAPPAAAERSGSPTPQPILAPAASPAVVAEETASAAQAAPPKEDGVEAAAAPERPAEPPPASSTAAPAAAREAMRPATPPPAPPRAAPPRVRPVTERAPPPNKTARAAPPPAPAATAPAAAGDAPPPTRTTLAAEPAPRQEPLAAPRTAAPADACAGLLGLQQAQCRACGDVSGVGRYACEQAQITRYCAGKWGVAPDCPWGSGTAIAGDPSVKP